MHPVPIKSQLKQPTSCYVSRFKLEFEASSFYESILER
jgi:hypothetical protein